MNKIIAILLFLTTTIFANTPIAMIDSSIGQFEIIRANEESKNNTSTSGSKRKRDIQNALYEGDIIKTKGSLLTYYYLNDKKKKNIKPNTTFIVKRNFPKKTDAAFGIIISITGKVESRIALKKIPFLNVGDVVFHKQKIKTDYNSEIVIFEFESKKEFVIKEKSYRKLPGNKDDQILIGNRINGELKFKKITKEQHFIIKTPHAVAGVR